MSDSADILAEHIPNLERGRRQRRIKKKTNTKKKKKKKETSCRRVCLAKIRDFAFIKILDGVCVCTVHTLCFRCLALSSARPLLRCDSRPEVRGSNNFESISSTSVPISSYLPSPPHRGLMPIIIRIVRVCIKHVDRPRKGMRIVRL